MDNYLDTSRFKSYFLVMANNEANQLIKIANAVALKHLKDAMVRVRFQKEIKEFIGLQLNAISISSSEEKWKECLQNIKQEHHYLSLQDNMLKTGKAVISTSVKFYHDHEKVIGYVINGIGVVVSGLQIVAGVGLIAGSVATGNIFGAMAGATVIANGFGSFIEHTETLRGIPNPSNPVREGYEDIAEFLGFDKRIGLLSYQLIDLTTSYYGIFKLTLKPDAWRLYRYLPTDYYRKVQVMSRPALALKGVSAAAKGAGIGANLYQMHNRSATN